jgi:TPR repeat protein
MEAPPKLLGNTPNYLTTTSSSTTTQTKKTSPSIDELNDVNYWEEGEQFPLVSELEEESRKGIAESSFKLGLRYLKGERGVEADHDKAICYFRMAGKQGLVVQYVYKNVMFEVCAKDGEGWVVQRSMAQPRKFGAYISYKCADHISEGDKSAEQEEKKVDSLNLAPDYQGSFQKIQTTLFEEFGITKQPPIKNDDELASFLGSEITTAKKDKKEDIALALTAQLEKMADTGIVAAQYEYGRLLIINSEGPKLLEGLRLLIKASDRSSDACLELFNKQHDDFFLLKAIALHSPKACERLMNQRDAALFEFYSKSTEFTFHTPNGENRKSALLSASEVGFANASKALGELYVRLPQNPFITVNRFHIGITYFLKAIHQANGDEELIEQLNVCLNKLGKALLQRYEQLLPSVIDQYDKDLDGTIRLDENAIPTDLKQQQCKEKLTVDEINEWTFLVGLLAINGWHVEKNVELGKKWLELARNEGHTGATNTQMLLEEATWLESAQSELENGNTDKAVAIYEELAEAGSATAHVELAFMYAGKTLTKNNELILRKNEEFMVDHLLAAARQGHAIAAFELAKWHWNDKYLFFKDENKKQAVKWFKFAARNGVPGAAEMLAEVEKKPVSSFHF